MHEQTTIPVPDALLRGGPSLAAVQQHMDALRYWYGRLSQGSDSDLDLVPPRLIMARCVEALREQQSKHEAELHEIAVRLTIMARCAEEKTGHDAADAMRAEAYRISGFNADEAFGRREVAR